MRISLQRLLVLATTHLLLTPTSSNRVVTFHYVENSGSCKVLTGDLWDIEIHNFYVDCGNANHGCTAGHVIMLDGDFTANRAFQTIADVDMKMCVFNDLYCSPNFVETEMNVCRELDLEDEMGYDECNAPGNYTLEANFTFPAHNWWEEVAFDGLTIKLYATFDEDLECQAQFVTKVYWGNEAWMAVAVSSLLFMMGCSFYISRKCCTADQAAIDLAAEEIKADKMKNKQRAKNTSEDDNDYEHDDDDEIVVLSSPSEIEKSMEDTRQQRAVKRAKDILGDDDSVTSTSYLRMLDFSPEGLTHAERMEQVRQAHFERLRNTRDSRRVSTSNAQALLEVQQSSSSNVNANKGGCLW